MSDLASVLADFCCPSKLDDDAKALAAVLHPHEVNDVLACCLDDPIGVVVSGYPGPHDPANDRAIRTFAANVEGFRQAQRDERAALAGEGRS